MSELSRSAHTQTFVLNRGRGMTVTVATTTSPAIYGSSGLDYGKVVEVTGRYNPTTDRLVATKIEVKGIVSSVPATAGTFSVTLRKAKGFAPSMTTINVATSLTTVFRTDGGRTKTPAEFFALLMGSATVEVEGSYDAASNTLMATKAKVENESHHDQDDHNGDGKIDSNDDNQNRHRIDSY